MSGGSGEGSGLQSQTDFFQSNPWLAGLIGMTKPGGRYLGVLSHLGQWQQQKEHQKWWDQRIAASQAAQERQTNQENELGQLSAIDVGSPDAESQLLAFSPKFPTTYKDRAAAIADVRKQRGVDTALSAMVEPGQPAITGEELGRPGSMTSVPDEAGGPTFRPPGASETMTLQEATPTRLRSLPEALQRIQGPYAAQAQPVVHGYLPAMKPERGTEEERINAELSQTLSAANLTPDQLQTPEGLRTAVGHAVAGGFWRAASRFAQMSNVMPGADEAGREYYAALPRLIEDSMAGLDEKTRALLAPAAENATLLASRAAANPKHGRAAQTAFTLFGQRADSLGKFGTAEAGREDRFNKALEGQTSRFDQSLAETNRRHAESAAAIESRFTRMEAQLTPLRSMRLEQMVSSMHNTVVDNERADRALEATIASKNQQGARANVSVIETNLRHLETQMRLAIDTLPPTDKTRKDIEEELARERRRLSQATRNYTKAFGATTSPGSAAPPPNAGGSGVDVTTIP